MHEKNFFKLLKGGHCFTPEDIGIQDVFVVMDKIFKVDSNISVNFMPDMEVIDCTGKILCPGFIDQHLHITGGGGEEGPVSRIPEIGLSDIVAAGISTVVGVLGFDSITRSIPQLLAKARALSAEGITTFIYTGSYGLPAATLTGKVSADISLIDKVIGVGEIAIADHRSSHPTLQQLKELASEARAGGLTGGKAGIVHIHVGDGKDGLGLLFELVEKSDFPLEMFIPTHLNRNKALFSQALEYGKRGGKIDLTAGETDDAGFSVSSAVQRLLEGGIPIGSISVSSDGNGSIPPKEGGHTRVGSARKLFDDIRECVLEKGIPMADALKLVTSNVARILAIHPRKGTLAPGSDADILILNAHDLQMGSLLIGGEFFVEDGAVTRKGRFE